MKEIVIVGGGVSGIMAAIVIKEQLGDNADVIIVERLERLGKKILVTGNGRCNFTNENMSPSKYNNPLFVTPFINEFNPSKVRSYFTELGLISYADKEGRVYPYTDLANSFLDILRMKMKSLSIIEKTNQEVKKIVFNNDCYFLETIRGFQIPADYLVLATGGKAAPIQGSNGSGYQLVKPFKVKVTDVFPGLVGIKIDPNQIKGLSGIRAFANVTLIDKKQKVKLFEERGEVQFKNDGISGIVMMQAELYMARSPKNNNIVIELDLLPDITNDDLLELLIKRTEEYTSLENSDVLTGLCAKMLAYSIIKSCKIDLSGYVSGLQFRDLNRIVDAVKHFTLEPKGFYDFDKAQVTVGGIDLSEVDKKTLELKKMPNAYAIGELLNVDGECGGYNIEWALASGYACGMDIVKKCKGK